MKQLQRILHAVASPRRLAMVALLLKRGEVSVGTIARIIGISIPTASRHLTALANADLLDRRQESLVAYYRIADKPSPTVRTLLDLIRHAA